jgi:Spy/CpxP family protein refolding chaperone
MSAKRLFHAITLTLIAAVFAASAVYAAEPPTGTTQPNRWESRLQQKLNLTEDQLAAFRQLHATRDVQAQRQQHKALRTAQGELRRLALNGADDATLQAKQTEVQNLLAQSMQQRLAALKQIGPILNADQREAFAKMMEGGWRHHGRPHPQQQPS